MFWPATVWDSFLGQVCQDGVHLAASGVTAKRWGKVRRWETARYQSSWSNRPSTVSAPYPSSVCHVGIAGQQDGFAAAEPVKSALTDDPAGVRVCVDQYVGQVGCVIVVGGPDAGSGPGLW
jgi:hypothetical protein